MSGLEGVLAGLGGDGRLVHLQRTPRRPARTAALSSPLPAPVADALGAGELWAHQADAIDRVRHGRSVAVATGTASGKSLCYLAPIAEAAWAGKDGTATPATALLLFPTKALARDQLRVMHALRLPGLVPAAYDADASPDERAWVRRSATAVLTNPDMVHAGLLPHHGRWATFLMRLRHVVVDEMHTLRGVYGSHVAHVLRRLRRVCALYGADPTFVFCSATIGRPSQLASSLCGLPVEEVTDDASPRGEALFALWNPPLVDVERGQRASAHAEVAALVTTLVSSGRRTIAFTRSRRVAELVAADVRRRLGPAGPSVRAYRGGYLAEERRQIEDQLASGALAGVVATSALELGIDIGDLDACVLDGFPGTIASMRQRAGRAGRDQRRSLAVLVAGQDQLDQYLATHPGELLSRPPEPAVVNPSNPFVLLPHLACAAYEHPLAPDDERWWGDDLEEAVRRLVLDDRLRVRRRRAYWAGRGSPAWSLTLRSGSGDEYRIALGDGTLVGTVDGSRAFGLVHPGAVYLHQGQAYQVDRLDLADRAAAVTPADGGELTQARTDTTIRILDDERRQRVGRAELHLGWVEVSEHVTGYQRKDAVSGEVLGTEVLDLPATRLITRAFWYVIEPRLLAQAGVARADWPGALHAAEHAGIGILPLFTICDRWDVGGVSTALQHDTGRPTIFVYDGYAGGAGIAELGFAAGRRHVEATLEVVQACPCAHGCPSCVQSPKCGNWNEPLDKRGAVALLRAVLTAPRASTLRPTG